MMMMMLVGDGEARRSSSFDSVAVGKARPAQLQLGAAPACTPHPGREVSKVSASRHKNTGGSAACVQGSSADRKVKFPEL